MNNKERGLREKVGVFDDVCDNKADDDLLSLIGQIPDEAIERGKYILCELIDKSAGIASEETLAELHRKLGELNE